MSAALAAILTVALGVVAPAPAPAPPDLAYRVTSPNVTVLRFPGWMDFDLGVNLIAGEQPFEVRAKRRSYAEPPVVTGLPDGMFTSFDGLADFSTIAIRTAAGELVREYDTAWCPNSYSSVRTRPDAPPSNPYPQGCGSGNPFAVGSVWGVQAGWSSPIGSDPGVEWVNGEPRPFTLDPGLYRVSVRLNEPYRSWLSVPASDADVTLNVTVVDYESAAAKTAKTAPRPAAAIGPRPDLRALPAWLVGLEPVDGGRSLVSFAATIWNAGTSPLVVDGYRRPGTDVMDAFQHLYDARGNETGTTPAGTMAWDARDYHQIWELGDFARYDLLAADRESVVRTGTQGYCLVNTDAVDYTLPAALWRPTNYDAPTECGRRTAVAVHTSLDIGNGDTSYPWVPGNSLDVTDLPNGTYYLRIVADPGGTLAESRTANNSSLRKVVLGGTPGGERTLRVPAVHGVDPPIG